MPDKLPGYYWASFRTTGAWEIVQVLSDGAVLRMGSHGEYYDHNFTFHETPIPCPSE